MLKEQNFFSLFFKLSLTIGIILESYPGLTLLCLFFACIFETGSHVAQADLKLTMYLNMSLDNWSTGFLPLQYDIPDICHHTKFILETELRASCVLGKHYKMSSISAPKFILSLLLL